jgi:hypothetical protein
MYIIFYLSRMPEFVDQFPTFSQALSSAIVTAWEEPNLPSLAGIVGTRLLASTTVEGKEGKIMDVQVGIDTGNNLIVHIKTEEIVSADHIVQLIDELVNLITSLENEGIRTDSVRCISDSTTKVVNPGRILESGALQKLQDIVGEEGRFFIIQPQFDRDIESLPVDQKIQAWLKSEAAKRVMPEVLANLPWEQKLAFAQQGVATYNQELGVFESVFPLGQGSFGVAPQGMNSDELLEAAYYLLESQTTTGSEG